MDIVGRLCDESLLSSSDLVCDSLEFNIPCPLPDSISELSEIFLTCIFED